MRFILIITSLLLFSVITTGRSSASASSTSIDDGSFEKSFQTLGKKMDQAKAKGEQLGSEAKKEWQALQAKTEKATQNATDKDWGTRVKGAFTEFGVGVKNAWNKLTDDK